MTIFYHFLLLCALVGSLCVAKEVPCGTLIVCYQSGPKEERLDRIRFRLQNSQYEGELYPKKMAVMTGDKCQQRHVVIENLPIGKYTLKFLVPNLDHYFHEVPEHSFELHPGAVHEVNQFIRPCQAVFKESNKFSLVDGGKAIIGDSFKEIVINALPATVLEVPAFLISLNETTNAEYARWLNQALIENEITFTVEGDAQGTVFDREGHILCKTKEREALSQISYRMVEGHVNFMPVVGKEDFPVIFVSWYGADLYCRSNGWHLPTEAEWEKAASMEIRDNSLPLRKFRFGFSSDEIDPTWGNYKKSDTSIENKLVHTTKVGYYNGSNKDTHNAKSPYGAYDMSGNVWEWVSDFYNESDTRDSYMGENKVVKGGCYDSLASGVRAAERLALPLSHTDAFTGFRVAAQTRGSKISERGL